MIWLAVVGILANQNLCQWCHLMWWGILTNQILDISVGLCGWSPWVSTGLHRWSLWVSVGGLCGSPWVSAGLSRWFGGRGQGKWLTGLMAGGKANELLTGLVAGARQMTDWFGSRGQGKWMTDWFGGRGQGKWMTGRWQGARQMTDWFGSRGQGKWMTDWFGGKGQGKWLTNVVSAGLRGWSIWVSMGGLVVGGKANDWLVWWQGARQMNDWLVWWQGARQMTDKCGLCRSLRVSAGGLRGSPQVSADDLVAGGKANDWQMWSLRVSVGALHGFPWVVWW